MGFYYLVPMYPIYALLYLGYNFLNLICISTIEGSPCRRTIGIIYFSLIQKGKPGF